MIFAGTIVRSPAPTFRNEMAAIGGTKNRPAQRHDSVHSLPIENDVIARRQQAFKSIAKTNHFPAELVRCEHHGAQNRIKPGTIPTAGQNTNARFHFRILFPCLSS